MDSEGGYTTGPGGTDSDTGSAAEAVYAELRRLADVWFHRQPAGHTLQPTAVVHEAFLKLANSDGRWSDEEHFKAIAATAMRQVLVDHARRKQRQRRGADWGRVTLTGLGSTAETESAIDMLALDEALERLGSLNARHARIVELRFFGGLEVEAVARVMDVSERTVYNDWKSARAWLLSQMATEPRS